MSSLTSRISNPIEFEFWRARIESKDTCTPLPLNEPHTTIQVVSTGKNATDMFSTGVVLSISCAEGYRLNVGNRTVRCKRGVWKPEKPACLLSNIFFLFLFESL